MEKRLDQVINEKLKYRMEVNEIEKIILGYRNMRQLDGSDRNKYRNNHYKKDVKGGDIIINR